MEEKGQPVWYLHKSIRPMPPSKSLPHCSNDKHGGSCIWIRWRFKLSTWKTRSRCTFDTQQTIISLFAVLVLYSSNPPQLFLFAGQIAS